MSDTDIQEQANESLAPDRPNSMGAHVLGSNQRQLGRYAILRELRKDSSSVTLLALDPVMHREVVLKAVRLPPPLDGVKGGDAETHALEQAFVRQAQAAGRLHHPYIVTVFEAARVHEVGFLAIERVNGRALHELLASGWRPDSVHCASLAARIADAIEYAHGQSIAHGHLGPQHVIVQPDGAPKVEGFGGWIDGGAAGEDALAHTEKLLPYFQNELTEVMRRRDIRAVIVLLHMMLTGKPPQMQAGDKGAQPKAMPILNVRPDTPAPLAQLVDEMLGAEHASAHRTAGDVRDILTAYIWNARKSHVAPATIGIPLAAPPEEKSQFGAAELNMGTHAEVANTSRTREIPPTIKRTITGTPLISKPVSNAATPLASAKTLPQPQLDSTSAQIAARQMLARIKPWVLSNKWPIAGACALVIIGLSIGVLLGRDAPTVPREMAPAVQDTAPTNAMGTVRLEVHPWGEIIIDGKPTGVAPPLQTVNLTAGIHTIEIRHGDQTAVSAQVNVDPTRVQVIQHRFK